MERTDHFVFRAPSEKDTERLGRALAKSVPEGGIILLSGGLAAGKTALSRYIFDELGVREGFCSPTFSIVNEYPLSDGRYCLHADLYRLADPEELLYTGFYDLIGDSVLSVIEWPEIITDAFLEYTMINIEVSYETGERTFDIVSTDRDMLIRLREVLDADNGL